jgi:hypothetical protein
VLFYGGKLGNILGLIVYFLFFAIDWINKLGGYTNKRSYRILCTKKNFSLVVAKTYSLVVDSHNAEVTSFFSLQRDNQYLRQGFCDRLQFVGYPQHFSGHDSNGYQRNRLAILIDALYI